MNTQIDNQHRRRKPNDTELLITKHVDQYQTAHTKALKLKATFRKSSRSDNCEVRISKHGIRVPTLAKTSTKANLVKRYM